MRRFSNAALLAVGLALGLESAQALPVVEYESRLELTLNLLAGGATSDGVTLATKSIELLSGGRAVPLLFDLPWPTAAQPCRLKLEARGSLPPGKEGGDVTLESWLELAGGRKVHATRLLEIREGSTHLVELFADHGRRLILAAQGARSERPVVRTGPVSQRPVQFFLEVQHVEGTRSETLETNIMNTFLGESVEYSFERGQDEEHESIRLLLRPIRIEGTTAEISVEVTGTLPGEPVPLVLSRSEQFLATRGTASSVTIGADGKAGSYRFLVTADF